MKLILNVWLIVFISQVILSENLPNKKNNDATQKKIKKVTYSQHATKLLLKQDLNINKINTQINMK